MVWAGAGGRFYKRHEEMFGGDGYVHELDCRDGFMGVHIY